jgi:hypothetical protein
MSDVEARKDGGEVARVLKAINECWLQGRPHDLAAYFHDDMTMVLPGFAGRVEGSSAVIAGYEDFCASARVHEYDELDLQIDVCGRTAVASNAFHIVYEREGQKYSSTGRDLFVFTEEAGEWRAVWRAMLDVTDEPV